MFFGDTHLHTRIGLIGLVDVGEMQFLGRPVVGTERLLARLTSVALGTACIYLRRRLSRAGRPVPQPAAQLGAAAATVGGAVPDRGTVLAAVLRAPGAEGRRPRRS